MKRRFLEIDVFGAEPSRGNALGVILDSEELTTDEMQEFAAWTNFSETTFLLPPTEEGADFKVRIFTPTRELPFAGHPTLGSCFAWLQGGNKPRYPDIVVQECAAGLIEYLNYLVAAQRQGERESAGQIVQGLFLKS